MIRSRGKFRIAVSDVPAGRCNFYGLWLSDGMSERHVIGQQDLVYRNLRSRFGDRIRLVGDGQDLPPLPVVPPPAATTPTEPEPECDEQLLDEEPPQQPERRKRRR